MSPNEAPPGAIDGGSFREPKRKPTHPVSSARLMGKGQASRLVLSVKLVPISRLCAMKREFCSCVGATRQQVGRGVLTAPFSQPIRTSRWAEDSPPYLLPCRPKREQNSRFIAHNRLTQSPAGIRHPSPARFFFNANSTFSFQKLTRSA